MFRGFSTPEIQALGGSLRLSARFFEKGQVIALEGEECGSVGIVAAGSVGIRRLYPSGKSITVDTLGAGSCFGEAIIFSETHCYPAVILAMEESQIVYLTRETVMRLCAESPVFLSNFLRTLSGKVLMLNQKIKSLSYQTVRQKVANVILETHQRQQASLLRLGCSRAEMADRLGIPQPSLSRELAAMKAEGWIDFERRTIRILNLEALERSLEA